MRFPLFGGKNFDFVILQNEEEDIEINLLSIKFSLTKKQRKSLQQKLLKRCSTDVLIDKYYNKTSQNRQR